MPQASVNVGSHFWGDVNLSTTLQGIYLESATNSSEPDAGSLRTKHSR